jgi:hypothetical protein
VRRWLVGSLASGARDRRLPSYPVIITLSSHLEINKVNSLLQQQQPVTKSTDGRKSNDRDATHPFRLFFLYAHAYMYITFAFCSCANWKANAKRARGGVDGDCNCIG